MQAPLFLSTVLTHFISKHCPHPFSGPAWKNWLDVAKAPTLQKGHCGCRNMHNISFDPRQDPCICSAGKELRYILLKPYADRRGKQQTSTVSRCSGPNKLMLAFVDK